MKTKKLVSLAGLGLGLSLMAGAAQAVALWSFEDDDIDFIIRPDGSGGFSAPLQSGSLQADPRVGDVFVSAIEIPIFTINGVSAIPAGQELTGVAAVQLTNITPGLPNGIGTQYTFAAYSGGLNAILALGGDPDAVVVEGAAGEGAVIALFLNGTSGVGGDINLELNRTTNPASNCSSVEDCIDQASRGSVFQVDGFSGDPDEDWTATQIIQNNPLDPTDIIGTVKNTANDTIVVGVNAYLSTFFNVQEPVGFINKFTGAYCGNNLGYVADNCVQFKASATLTGGQGLSNGAVAHSDFDGQKYVPEPGTMALFGAGLFALGGLRRRQTKTV